MPICRATHKIKSQAFLRKFAEGQAFFQLRRSFAHYLALCSSGKGRAGPYASINHPVPSLMAELV